MFESLRLSDLPKMQCPILRESKATRPCVWLVEKEGVRAVVKDYSTCNFFFRNTFGRFLIWREVKAYKKMGDFQGVPNLYGVIDGLALVVQEIPGTTLKNIRKGTRLEHGFFDALRELVSGLQRRGLAHCDLKSKGNILVGQDGLPYIIDWAAAISKSEFRLPLFSRIYQRFVLDDYNAVIKHTLFYRSELVTFEEKERFYHRNWAEKTIRYIRDRLRAFLQAVS